ncbi:peptidase S13 [Sphingobacterium sp. DK4209]|uniref:Peptidase S13 n=1 Tax=Sphingobacterium zhuxiongii TaxID=2662364 RepID=A0A5Q0QAE1_9SPHI|nr:MULTISPECIES: D-alanyl-D-alanine carboxypeptidase [unclassified Sphingobacterium]MVZ65172.1 peptidase S13 [Sphingobacterium sp. DK4209]QGA26119.1 peptidase S13 [Sphingobacterium sp. dk4302]
MKRIVATLWALIMSFSLFAQNYSELNGLFQNSTVLNKHYVGFSLYDLASKQYVYGQNEDKHFTPASNTKVFTLYTALKLIGDSIPAIAYVERGDSLIFWGTGDPTFLHPKFKDEKVFQFLRDSNKKLYYSSAKSQEPFYRNGWSVEDYEYYYQPEVSVFPMYGNVILFKEKSGKLVLSPKYFDSHISHKDDTTSRFLIHRDYGSNKMDYNSVPLPKEYINEKPFHVSDSLIQALLQDTLHRSVGLVELPLPMDAKVLHSEKTSEVIREMMLPSDNFLAEQLNMVASFVKNRSFQTKSLRQQMQDDFYRFFPDTIELRDGSGLSSYNKFTPRAMVTLLNWIHSDIPDEQTKLHLFPAGGLEGTLKGVYPTPGGKAFVWAKTGTINSVHCQSGYIITKQGRRYAFSFLNNNFMGSAGPIRKEMVKIVTHIYENF